MHNYYLNQNLSRQEETSYRFNMKDAGRSADKLMPDGKEKIIYNYI